MKVSIITAAYNSDETIADTILSVQQQTYSNMEHIIIDGASTDKTLSIIQHWHKGQIISEKDEGIYHAMNKGIAIANGDIIGILNSDDFYSSNNVIEQIVNLFQQTNCDAVYGDLIYVDAKNTNRIKRKWISGKYSRASFLYGWMPPHPTFFIKKKYYQQFGNFNLQLGSAADYELMLRMLLKHQLQAAYLPKVIVTMRVGGISNKTIRNRIFANKNDRLAWVINDLKPYFFTLYLKPLRKIIQFI